MCPAHTAAYPPGKMISAQMSWLWFELSLFRPLRFHALWLPLIASENNLSDLVFHLMSLLYRSFGNWQKCIFAHNLLKHSEQNNQALLRMAANLRTVMKNMPYVRFVKISLVFFWMEIAYARNNNMFLLDDLMLDPNVLQRLVNCSHEPHTLHMCIFSFNKSCSQEVENHVILLLFIQTRYPDISGYTHVTKQYEAGKLIAEDDEIKIFNLDSSSAQL